LSRSLRQGGDFDFFQTCFMPRLINEPMPSPALRRYFRYHFRGWFCARVEWTIVTYISFFQWRKMNTG
jgi:hypothetical protein